MENNSNIRATQASGGHSTTKATPVRRTKLSDKENNLLNACRALDEDTVEELRDSWESLDLKGYGEQNYHQANGIIQSLIDQGLSICAIKGTLEKVGNNQIDRIRKNPVQVPRNAFKCHNTFSEDDIGRIIVFSNCLEKEDGFPCAHRQPRQYLTKEGATAASCWRVYSMVMKSNGFRASGVNRFNEYWKHCFPGLRCTQLKSDACDSCVRIDIALQDPDITSAEIEDLKSQQSMHLEAAKAQRRFMNAAVTASAKSWIDNAEDCFDGNVEIIPEELEILDTPPVVAGYMLRNVIVQCEDFGQSIAMPHYGHCQPGLDYFNSNLMMYEFVVSDTISKQNNVYFLRKNPEEGW